MTARQGFPLGRRPICSPLRCRTPEQLDRALTRWAAKGIPTETSTCPRCGRGQYRVLIAAPETKKRTR